MMTMNKQDCEKIRDFLNEIKILSEKDARIKLYPYENREKLYSRFLKKVITLDESLKTILRNGWLSEIYRETNGMDLYDYYVIPFNKYFNKKPFSFDETMYEWRLNPNDGNEYMDDFYPFLTNGKQIIGLCGSLKDKAGNHCIGILGVENKHVVGVTVVASNVYLFFGKIMEQIKTSGELLVGENTNLWKKNDEELIEKYNHGEIADYRRGIARKALSSPVGRADDWPAFPF